MAEPCLADLKEGRWVIGDGHQIPLSHPNWFKCSSHDHIRNNLLDGTVTDLINQNFKNLETWFDYETVSTSHLQGNLATSTIRTSSLEEKLLWRHSNSREYKVNKAYSMLQEIHHPSMLQEGRNHGLPQSVRKLIWKVKLPYKIRDKVLHLSHNYFFFPVFGCHKKTYITLKHIPV